MSETPRLREPGQRVSPRARVQWVVVALARSAVVLLVAIVLRVGIDGLDGVGWGWSVALAVLLAAYVVVVPQWRWLVHRWEVTDTAVYTQTGWWAREQRIAPISRIQTVDRSESAVQRVFGLATVTVTTASAAGALEIEGLDRERARELVAELTARADAVAGDAT